MPDERLTSAEVKNRVREVQAELSRLRREEQELTKLEYGEMLDEFKPMINKCFFRQKCAATGHIIKEFLVIVAYPPLEITRTSVSFNKYQLPCIRFHYCGTYFYPANLTPPGNDDEVFQYDTIFTGELPKIYHNGCRDNRDPNYLWEECDQALFLFYAEQRFHQYMRAIFEPTTPAP